MLKTKSISCRFFFVGSFQFSPKPQSFLLKVPQKTFFSRLNIQISLIQIEAVDRTETIFNSIIWYLVQTPVFSGKTKLVLHIFWRKFFSNVRYCWELFGSVWQMIQKSFGMSRLVTYIPINEIILQIRTLSQFSPSFFMVHFHFSHTNSEGNGQSCFRHKKMVTKKVQNSSIVGYFSIQSGYVKKRYPVSQNLGQTT